MYFSLFSPSGKGSQTSVFPLCPCWDAFNLRHWSGAEFLHRQAPRSCLWHRHTYRNTCVSLKHLFDAIKAASLIMCDGYIREWCGGKWWWFDVLCCLLWRSPDSNNPAHGGGFAPHERVIFRVWPESQEWEPTSEKVASKQGLPQRTVAQKPEEQWRKLQTTVFDDFVLKLK